MLYTEIKNPETVKTEIDHELTDTLTEMPNDISERKDYEEKKKTENLLLRMLPKY